MISVFGQSVGNSGFEPPSGQTKKTPYIIVICCLSTKHANVKEEGQRLVVTESEQCVPSDTSSGRHHLI
jgi:hypothetical protein